MTFQRSPCRKQIYIVGLIVFASTSVLALVQNPLVGVGGKRSLSYCHPCSRPVFVRVAATTKGSTTTTNNNDKVEIPDQVDVVIIGAGLGGLCAGAILNTLYKKRVAVFESHYLAGGCAHAFPRKASNGETFLFDSGPTILLG